MDQVKKSFEINNDPDYSLLLEHFQRAEFSACESLLEKLERKFPEHPDLIQLKEELAVKLSLENYASSIRLQEVQRKKKVALNMSIFAVIAMLIVVVVFVFSFILLDRNATAKRLAENEATLSSLQYQAEQLLESGQPQQASEIIEKMKVINPEYINLSELISRSDNLSQLEARYRTAIELINKNNIGEAYIILKEIEQEIPGLWDIKQQIAKIETSIKVAELIEEGDDAFQVKNWNQVIDSYENALNLDPTLNDPKMKERLLQSYLNEILRMVEIENISGEDVQKADEYYRKAISMAPQSQAFVFEKENLQKARNNLLVLKLSHSARTKLEDKNQTLSSISEAVSHLREAVNIRGESSSLNDDLNLAESYNLAFTSFIDSNWEKAIFQLKYITNIDSNYANGNAAVLLYESYFALGKRYDSLGLYFDALSVFQQAEIIAWEDPDNLMKLFQVQVMLGDLYGQVKDFYNAISYYQYALNAIQVNKRITDLPSLAAKFTEANNLAALRKYEESFVAFQEALQEIDVVFSVTEKDIGAGICLAFFASENLSTIDAVVEANNLPATMVFTFRQNLRVPRIIK
jgi:tetratricopeptide (TPR) repeat protein